MENELASFDRAAQVSLEVEPVEHRFVHARLEQSGPLVGDRGEKPVPEAGGPGLSLSVFNPSRSNTRTREGAMAQLGSARAGCVRNSARLARPESESWNALVDELLLELWGLCDVAGVEDEPADVGVVEPGRERGEFRVAVPEHLVTDETLEPHPPLDRRHGDHV